MPLVTLELPAPMGFLLSELLLFSKPKLLLVEILLLLSELTLLLLKIPLLG